MPQYGVPIARKQSFVTSFDELHQGNENMNKASFKNPQSQRIASPWQYGCLGNTCSLQEAIDPAVVRQCPPLVVHLGRRSGRKPEEPRGRTATEVAPFGAVSQWRCRVIWLLHGRKIDALSNANMCTLEGTIRRLAGEQASFKPSGGRGGTYPPTHPESGTPTLGDGHRP